MPGKQPDEFFTGIATGADDGDGFEPDPRPPDGEGGLGLASIRERLMSMGGRLHVDSAPGRGARVIMELPLRPEPLEEPAHAVASLAG